MTSRDHISIRPATIDDAETIHAAILGIAEAVDELHKVKSTPNDIRRFGFGPNPAFEALIAEVEGVFAGLCLFFPSFSTWQGRPGVYVQDLFVAKEFRGLGVGEKLLKRLAAVTRARGGRYIRLSVDSGNLRAQAFYERLGLRLSGAEQIHAAYREDFDALADAGDHEGETS
ncbi:GNAT family N-acetyltransferase [Allomesorhizobium camelthorni]|uniref:GNAT family N-acetyltransferase n=1 Tax=Allomesorhizobium camelthorni TaxID=475069 RepID=A0A6G4WGD2_9HYPH|nr:GNAT family N-acetyltransferase [Mesorhizobium camelthorni]NGO53659.1 GNAT family N-acetyltransferase [Mesorhizobium camelthorni]